MLERQIAQNETLVNRLKVLKDNSDKVEEMTYHKHFSPEQLTQKRGELENVSISISDLNKEKKEYMANFKAEMDPLAKNHAKIIDELKAKSAEVTELCYCFLDEESRMMGFYNGEGILIYSRPASQAELNRTIQMEMRKTGTDF